MIQPPTYKINGYDGCYAIERIHYNQRVGCIEIVDTREQAEKIVAELNILAKELVKMHLQISVMGKQMNAMDRRKSNRRERRAA